MMETPNLQIPEKLDFAIPKEFLDQFEKEVRVVVRFPWIIGIPVPDYLLKRIEVLNKVKEFDLMFIPKEMGR
jgi:hypothetical protein